MAFEFQKTPFRYRAYYKDGKWYKKGIEQDDIIHIHESSIVLHYSQTAYEGMKAFRTKEGKIVIFRPDLNESRFAESCARIEMPTLPEGVFMEAVIEAVRANADYVPEYGTGESLYIRPFMFGHGAQLGMQPAHEYIFSVFVLPVKKYKISANDKSGAEDVGIKLVTSEFDRAAPLGTGGVKIGGNYAGGFYPRKVAMEKGYADCIFLDAKTRTKIEELNTSNFIAITKDNVLVTPDSSTILKSNTRKTLLHIAEHYLGMKVEEREVGIEELADFKEAAACGTAVVLSVISSITHEGKEYKYDTSGGIMDKLYDTYVKIQYGDIEAPKGWLIEV